MKTLNRKKDDLRELLLVAFKCNLIPRSEYTQALVQIPAMSESRVDEMTADMESLLENNNREAA